MVVVWSLFTKSAAYCFQHDGCESKVLQPGNQQNIELKDAVTAVNAKAIISGSVS